MEDERVVINAIAAYQEMASSFGTTEIERQRTEEERQRPFILLKPRMFPDGNQWCALYGDNLQEGVAGFGDTPQEAAEAFDESWNGQVITCGKPAKELITGTKDDLDGLSIS